MTIVHHSEPDHDDRGCTNLGRPTGDRADNSSAQGQQGRQLRQRGHSTARLSWWKEVVLVLVFYGAYTAVRNHFGSAAVPSADSYANALKIIGLEQRLGIFNEQHVQDILASSHITAASWNTFYGSLHFIVTIGTLVYLFRRWPSDYRRMRNVLGFTTGLALAGFALFPLMPPRLLCDCPFGAGADAQAQYGFVDTLARDGSLWSFGSPGIKAMSNQYAAMPSLHFAWALWCALALFSRLRRRWPRSSLSAMLYPALTLAAVTATANHFWLDAVGGAVVLMAGWLLGTRFTTWAEKHRKNLSREYLKGVLVLPETGGVP